MKKILVLTLVNLIAWGMAVWDALAVWVVFDWASGAFTLDRTDLFVFTAATQVAWYQFLKAGFDE